MLIRTTLILSVALALAIGCSSADEDSHEGHDHGAQEEATEHGSMDHGSMENSGGEMDSADAAERNALCPVMGGETTDSEIFAEYKGKKVFFCCDGCIDDFEKDPEKYFAKAYSEAK